MIYINEGTNADIVAEFNKLRLAMVKDKVSFNAALLNNDYKKAREIATRINDNCELFYRKLDRTDITVTEALVGTSAKMVRDMALIVGGLFLAMEGGMKAVEVAKGANLKKSEKKEIRKFAYNTAVHGSAKDQTLALIAGGAFDSVVKICASIITKVSGKKNVTASDLNSYYVEIRNKMKVLCVKSKMLINEVDVLEKKIGASKKKEELEKELKDAKNIFKESEGEYVMTDIYNEGVISRALAKSDNTPKAKTVYNAWCSPNKPISKENAIKQIKKLESSNKLNSNCGWNIIQVLTILDYPQSKFNKIAEKIDDSKDAKYMFAVTYDDPNRAKKEKDAYDEYIKGKYKIVAHDGFGNHLIYSIKNGKFFDYFHEEDCGDDLSWLKTGVTYKDAINYTKKQLLNLDDNMKESEEFIVDKNLINDELFDSMVENYWNSDVEDDDLTLEGANLDTRKVFKENKKKYKEALKAAKVALKANNFNEARKQVKESIKILEKAKKEMDKVEDKDSIASAILGY